MLRLFIASVILLFATTAFGLKDKKEINQAYASILLDLPKAGQLINIPFPNYMQSYGKRVTVSIEDSEGVPGGEAVQIKVRKPAKSIWDAGLNSLIIDKLMSGDTLVVGAWLRAVEQPEGAKVEAVLQQSIKPYRAISRQPVELTPEWKLHYFSTVANDSYPSEETQFSLQYAQHEQIIEVGPIFVLNLGPGVDRRSLPKTER